jgi:hypothetical protein
MLINEKDALARVNSPLNLLNRLRSAPPKNGMSLFIGKTDKANEQNPIKIEPAVPAFTPFSPAFKTASDTTPTTAESVKLDEILDGAENKIKLAHAHDRALGTLVAAIDQMNMKLDDIKPDKLPSVITATAKVVEGIRRERNEAAKAMSGKAVHLHFYTPTQKKLEDYEVIDVG